MKKIPTLFERIYINHRVVETTPNGDLLENSSHVCCGGGGVPGGDDGVHVQGGRR